MYGDPRPIHTLPRDLFHVTNDHSVMEMQVDVRRHHTAPEMTSELELMIIRRNRQLRNESRDPGTKVRGPLGTELTLEESMRRHAFDVWAHEQDLRTALRPGSVSSSTLMKVIASPQPSSARAASAMPYDGERAKRELSEGEQHRAQAQHLLGAEPVHQQADGYLHARVDQQLEDGGRTWTARTRHVEPSAASRPATPRDVRKMTATKSTETPIPRRRARAVPGGIAGQRAGAARGGAAHRTSPRARWENQPTCRWTASTAASASPERSARRISSCSVRVLLTRSGWECITACPMRS
ncbi:hypothetical protein STENM223S_02562 [Streptomyces tendae]